MTPYDENNLRARDGAILPGFYFDEYETLLSPEQRPLLRALHEELAARRMEHLRRARQVLERNGTGQ